ncbi:transposase [Streptomyces sp. NPDC059849]|uniref:transposase n=1 Tax=Streptomyces sp. NPDC059849 TaxID=3346969 RepID=UPI0036489AAB
MSWATRVTAPERSVHGCGSGASATPSPNWADRIRNRLRRGRHDGRPPVFDAQFYKRRNVVERCFNRLKHCRGIATRYDKTAESYQATLTLASS